MRQHALEEAKKDSQIILDHYVATHTYFSKELKPAVFHVATPVMDDTYFEPAWMSSTYAVREIDNIFQDMSQVDYYYKECAINARSPENEADEFERAFLEKINADPKIMTTSSVRKIKKRPYFVVLRQAEKMEKSCLQCHGKPQNAPGKLLEIYGRERSFNRKLGEIVSAVSIRIPLTSAYSDANDLSLFLSCFFIGLLSILYGIQYFVFKRNILRPLSRLQTQAEKIASGADPIGTQVLMPRGKELVGIAQAFNHLSYSIRNNIDNLECIVYERTQHLVELNQILEKEIESHKKTNTALRESKAMLQAAMDYSQAGVAIARAPDGQLLYVNDSALNIRGEVKEKIVDGIGIDQYVASWQILHFDETPYQSEEVPLTRAILFGEVCTEEFIVRRPDQEDRIVWANAAPIKNDAGDILYGIVVFLDITDRKKAEQENAVNRIRLDISHEIAAMSETSEAKICDYALERMLELSESQIGFWGYITPDGQEMQIHKWSNEAMAECAVHDKPINFPITQAGVWGEPVRTRSPIILNDYDEFHPAKKGYPEGHVRISRFMAVPVVDDGKIVAVAAVANSPRPYQTFDTQQLILLMKSVWNQIQRFRFNQERESLQSQMRQVQRIEAIGNLAAGIAHDFNNILFPIVGLSEMLLEDLPADSMDWENAREILQAGKRGSELVNQILTFSRQSEQKRIPVRIQQILKEVMKLSRSTIPTSINMSQEIQSDCGLVFADPTQVHQIAMNLITNAYHAVEAKGGEITVRLREIKFGSEQLPKSDLLPGRYALMSISDTGTGIAPANKEKIFDPYFTTKEQGKGTGLGLAVAYGIVKEHQGDIEVYSTDMTMPNITGDRLARELIAIRPDIPIIVCTGFSERIDQGKAETIGIRGLLMKPVIKAEMAKTVRSVLDGVETKS